MAAPECSWYEYYLAPRPGERLVEVERMRALNEDCVPLLCEHLTDSRLRVRIIAAQTLAEIGDERAIAPLCVALETADRGVSPWARWLATCVGIVFSAIITLIAVLSALSITRIWHTVDGGESIAADWKHNMSSLQGHELFLTAVIDALDRIIERHPLPAARRALTPLNRLADDSLRHQSDTRGRARRTAHRINLSTLNCHRLPLPSAAAAHAPAELPVPAEQLNAQAR